MRSSRRQRNLPPEASATMENMGGRLSNSASNARPSPSPSPEHCREIVSVPAGDTILGGRTVCPCVKCLRGDILH